MRTRFYFVTVAAILLFLCPLWSWGQEQKPTPQGGEPKAQEETKPTVPLLWGFNTDGQITMGYRFATVKGDMSQYNNIYNLRDGFRLFDVNLSGRAPEGSHLFADSYSLMLNGLGGEPYSGGQLTLRKDKVYDLRINYRQSYDYWSQNNIDSQVMAGIGIPAAQGGSPSGFTNGLTPNHGWATVRRMGSVDLSVRATDHLQFTFEYNRNSRDGTMQSTRNLYYPGNPNAGWGSFSTANPYVVAGPVNDLDERIIGGVNYTLHNWTFRYRAGYQSFTENTGWNNVSSKEISINTSPNVPTTSPSNVGAITAQEVLNNAAWSEFRSLKSPVSEFSYTGIVNNWLELRGAYNYYQFSGPFTADASFVGTARAVSNGSSFTPYTVALNNRAQLQEPTHEVSQGLTANIKPWWKLYADYRYVRLTSDSFGTYGSIYNGTVAVPTTSAPGQVQDAWRIGTHYVDVSMEFVPLTSLVIRPGIRYVKRDAEQFTNGAINNVLPANALNPSTARTKNVLPTLSVFYKPVKTLTVQADFRSNTTSKPYLRLSPHTDTSSRFIVRFQPTSKISIEDNLVVRNSELTDSFYQNRYRSNAVNLSYDVSSKFSFNTGYIYENIFAKGGWVRASTTTPFDGFYRDGFVNRSVRGSLLIKPVKNFGIELSGNYLRTTGSSEMTSTAPTAASVGIGGLPIVWPVDVGPLTFPLVTGTLYYDFPQAGRLSVDLQRSYYIEQIVKGNNFQANMLTIKWTVFLKRGGE